MIDVVVLGETLLSQHLVQDDVLHRVEHIVHLTQNTLLPRQRQNLSNCEV